MPERTCVGCRAHGGRGELLRVVARPPLLVVDPSARLVGRGAWLHPTAECFEKAVRRRAFGRALKVSVALDTAELEDYLAKSAPVGIATRDSQ